MSSNDLLQLFYQHHLWSNLRLFDACLTLNADQLNHSDSGTYGSILATLTHLVRAEERYLFFLTGGEFTASTTNAPLSGVQSSISELKARCQISSTKLLEVANSIQSDKQVQVGKGKDAEFIPANIILLQAVHHAYEHRTQVSTLLGQLGIEPPALSGWRYYDDHKVNS